jgi:heterotetrameric sarcosine oxidase gamma subunit
MIYDVSIEMLDLFCVFDLKGKRSHIASVLASIPINLPESSNTATTSGDMVLCWVGPTQWILRASQAAEQKLMLEFQLNCSERNTSVVDISDMLQFFSVQGRDVDEVLAICCPLDFHLEAFRGDTATFTEFLGTKALLLRVADAYQFAVERSYADFINDNLHRILGTPLPVDHAGQAPYELGG